MLSITCGKCNRRFTLAMADLQGYLADSAGKKFELVLCPHCGYGNKVAVSRLQQAVKVPGQQASTQTTPGEVPGQQASAQATPGEVPGQQASTHAAPGEVPGQQPSTRAATEEE